MMLETLVRQDVKPVKVAILMSGSGSNAVRILEREQSRKSAQYSVDSIVTDNAGSNALEIADRFGKDHFLFDFERFLHEAGADRKDMSARAEYDSRIRDVLGRRGTDLIVLAGYDLIVTPELCDAFLTVNVHPGDLRPRDENGKRRYVGLGWIPSAKAMLDGQRYVCSTTHIVTPDLDDGPILMVSEPVSVDLGGVSRQDLLPEGMTLKRIIKERRLHGTDDLPETHLERIAKKHQEELKVRGDWRIFPLTVEYLAHGLFERDAKGKVYFSKYLIPTGLEYDRSMDGEA